MENPSDDPREFHRGGPDVGGDEFPLGLETFMSSSLVSLFHPAVLSHRATVALQGMAERGAAEPRVPTRSPEPRSSRSPERRSNVSQARPCADTT